MSQFEDLPNELILRVFLASPDISSAASLSRVNGRFNDIWSENMDRIITGVLENHIPAGDEAIAFAKLQTQSEDPSVWAPVVRLNAEICERVHRKWHKRIQDVPSHIHNWRLEVAWTFWPRSYYIVRQVVFAVDGHHPLLPGLISRLDAEPVDTLRTHYGVYYFLWDDLDDAEMEVHGITVEPERSPNDIYFYIDPPPEPPEP